MSHQTLKPSYYNFFFAHPQNAQQHIAYNAYTNALAVIDADKYDALQSFIENGDDLSDDDFRAQLKRSGFLIDDDVNELERIRFKMLKSRYNTDAFQLTITVTADCNFACAYCYEKEVIKHEYMTTETADKIFEIVKMQMPKISLLDVHWYGGEPLLNMDIILYLSEKFITLCKEHNVQYKARMVTNGYLLSSEYIEQINASQISMLQITIDGDKEIHDRMRPLLSGEGSYDVIMKNIAENIDQLPQISLRINVDKNNTDAAKKVSQQIKDNGWSHKVFPYLGRIRVDLDDESFTNCYCGSEFSLEELKYMHELDKDSMSQYPRLKHNYCGADCINSLTLSANGDIYKCWKDIGIVKNRVGALSMSQLDNERLFFDYMLYDPTTNETCSQCKYLPLCMGGCPLYRIEGVGDTCIKYKYFLNDYINHTVNHITAQQSAS